MKTRKLLSSLAAVASAAIMAVPSGAYLTVASDPVQPTDSSKTQLISSNDAWDLSIDASYDERMANELTHVCFVVKFEGDKELYEKEKTAGVYDETENPFVDFTGHIGIGPPGWHEFKYDGIDGEVKEGFNCTPIALGDNEYVFYAYMGDQDRTLDPAYQAKIKLADWGNRSSGYSLTVEGLYIFGDNGTPFLITDENGNITADPENTDRLKAIFAAATGGEAPAEETTTTAAETTAAPAEETAAAEETTAVTTQRPQNNANVQSAEAASSSDLAERDSSLMIVLIIAGVLIVGVAAVLIILFLRRNK